MDSEGNRFEVIPSSPPKVYHVMSVLALIALILILPINFGYQLALCALSLIYGWFAWPATKCAAFDARLNQTEGHLTLKSALNLYLGWRLELIDGSKSRVVWLFHAQLSREEQRKIRVASHIGQMKRQRSI